MSRLSIWTMSSSSNPSTPTLPATPSTPPQPSPRDGDTPSTPLTNGASPMKMRLPTPSSFSQRIPTTPTAPERQDEPRSPEPRTRPTSLYTIPQKSIPTDLDSAYIRRGPPSALTLQPLRMPIGPGSSPSPFSRSIPVSAPLSKVATIGAARRLSESRRGGSPMGGASQTMSRSKSTSIWAEGLSSARTSGWISPALGTGRSMVSSTGGRPRGLQVAVLNDEKKDLILGDVPHHPGTSGTPCRAESVGMEREEAKPHDPEAPRHEIILCRYHHTPGLTCTSRPCRFVHALESLGLPSITLPPSTAPVTFTVLSPHRPDPTEGTFAQAQQLKAPKSTWRNPMPAGVTGMTGLSGLDRSSLLSPTIPTLAVKDSGIPEAQTQEADGVFGGMEPGRRVVLSTDDGVLNGTVFLMSGGGKGPVGKSKAKYKTVPCKDYAAGHCPYGDYCSFIHQNADTDVGTSTSMVKTKSADALSLLESADIVEVPSDAAPDSPRRRRYSTGSYATVLVAPKFEPTISAIQDTDSESSGTSAEATQGQVQEKPTKQKEERTEPVESASTTKVAPKEHRAWLQAVPKNTLVPSVKVDVQQFEKLRPSLSAFAPAFQQRPVVVDSNGEIRPSTIPEHPKVSEPSESQDTEPITSAPSAWSRGPPPSLKSLTLKKISNPHLAPPPSAFSTFGTESDPATPWDPALRQQQIHTIRQTAWDPTLPMPPSTSQDWPSVTQASTRQEQAEHHVPGASVKSQVHPEYASSLFVPPTPLATPLHPPMIPPYYHGGQYDSAWSYALDNTSQQAPGGQAWYPPPPVMYPWGMPMSPVLPPARERPNTRAQGIQGSHAAPGKDKTQRSRNHRRGMSTPADLLKLPGGLGVMWTPAGWAVQDAAMKLDLSLAEMKLSGESAEGKEKKSYYKSRQCIFFSQGHCPHGDQCSYRHDPPSRTSSPSDPSTELMTPAPLPTSSNGSPTKRKPIPILPCKFYNSASGCSRGSECTFLHAIVVPQSAPLVDRPRPWRTKQCRHWLVGRCTLGDACHFAHVDANGNDEHAKNGAKGVAQGPIGQYGYGPYDSAAYGLVNGPAGNGWGGYAAEISLSEENVMMAMRDIKRYTSNTTREESDDEDDDLEIVTDDPTATPHSSYLAFSQIRQWGGY